MFSENRSRSFTQTRWTSTRAHEPRKQRKVLRQFLRSKFSHSFDSEQSSSLVYFFRIGLFSFLLWEYTQLFGFEDNFWHSFSLLSKSKYISSFLLSLQIMIYSFSLSLSFKIWIFILSFQTLKLFFVILSFQIPNLFLRSFSPFKFRTHSVFHSPFEPCIYFFF